MKNLRYETGTPAPRIDIRYLQSRLDYDEVLEGLGIDIAFHLGDQIMCHCPNPDNHSNGDKNPSFGFNTEEMIYNCFVCGGGSLLSLVQQQLLLSEDDAVAWLQHASTLEPKSAADIRQKLAQLMNPIKQESVMPEYSFDAIFKYKGFHPYLTERGITPEVAAEMQVGFDPDHYGIMIPHVWRGKLVGWQMRHLLEEGGVYYCGVCQDPVPKYKSTTGLPKSITIYNYDNAVAGKFPSVIVVESPMTVLKLMSEGWRNVVATFGSFSAEQMGHLSIFPRVYIWPDNDPAGVKNLKVGMNTLKNLTDVRIVPVVDKHKGDGSDVPKEQVRDYLEAAILPASLAFYKTPLPTLAEVFAHTNKVERNS